YRRGEAKSECGEWCVRPGPTVDYLGWHGTRHEFEITSRAFARAFMEKNRAKVASVDQVAQAILQEIDAEQEEIDASAKRSPSQGGPANYARPPEPAPTSHVARSAPQQQAPRAHFHGPGSIVRIAGRHLSSPLVYVADTSNDADASTLITTLPVG